MAKLPDLSEWKYGSIVGTVLVAGVGIVKYLFSRADKIAEEGRKADSELAKARVESEPELIDSASRMFGTIIDDWREKYKLQGDQIEALIQECRDLKKECAELSKASRDCEERSEKERKECADHRERLQSQNTHQQSQIDSLNSQVRALQDQVRG